MSLRYYHGNLGVVHYSMSFLWNEGKLLQLVSLYDNKKEEEKNNGDGHRAAVIIMSY